MSDITEFMYQRWSQSLGSIFVTAESDRLFNTVKKFYSEPHRHYHNFEHIKACLEHFDTVIDKLSNPLLVEISIWFHDLIYNPKKSNNEKQSAELAKQFLQPSTLTPSQITIICHNIIATIHPSKPTSPDQAYLLDIDLSILASDNELYDQYENWIRKEYQHVPTFFFTLGRKKLLRSFLELDSIYYTDYFRDLWQKKAVSNILRTIDCL